MSPRRYTHGFGFVCQRKDGYCVATIVGGKRIMSYHKTERDAQQRVNDTLCEYQLGSFADGGRP